MHERDHAAPPSPAEREAQLLKWARELADPNFCLSVPGEAKAVIGYLIELIEARQPHEEGAET